jgi:L-2-hydroxyglutarate oxidase
VPPAGRDLQVTGIKSFGSQKTLETTQGEISAKLVINCAGLQSDRISRMANAKLDLKIVPFRGEYYDLAPFRTDYLRGFIYPVPDPRFPFLGVHFTRRMAGGIEAGPNAVLALTREGYSKRAFDAGDVIEFAVFPGFWIMAAKYWQTSLGRVLSFVEQSGLRPSPTTADARYHGGRFDSRRLGSSSSGLG